MSPSASLARQGTLMLDDAEHGMTEAARRLGVSLSWLYELRGRYQRSGEVGRRPRPAPKRRQPRPVSPAVEDAIVSSAIARPTPRPRRVADSLRRERVGGIRVARGTVWSVLRRYRLAESRGLKEGGPIAERTLRELRARQRREMRQLGSDTLGQELFLDTMDVGEPKGVGLVWQFAAIDGACSLVLAQALAGERRQAQAIAFVTERLLPVYEEAGIKPRKGTTDRGPEFGGAFREALRKGGIRRPPLTPRSPALSGLVKRLHGTILHEHYRVAFRLRSYASAADIDDLQGFRRYSSFERSAAAAASKGPPPPAASAPMPPAPDRERMVTAMTTHASGEIVGRMV